MMPSRLAICLAALLFVPLAAIAQPQDALTEIFSQNGVLSATLVAAAGKVHVGELELDGLTYNGIYAGPVLHVHPGDVMRIRLVNHLSEPTNLHFHGMRSSPLGNGDNAHLLVQPNNTLDYKVTVPITQPAGLYWYHAHAHKYAQHQAMGGLTGTIIVEATTPLPIKQILFVMKDMVFDDETGNAEIDDNLHGVVQSVNGRLTTNLNMQPGETQLWRFTNQSANRFLHIALDGHCFRIIGQDGEPNSGEQAPSVLDIPPGSRFDALVEAGAIGRYALTVKGLMTGTGSTRVSDRVMGYLNVTGDAVPAKQAMAEPRLPPDLRNTRVDATRTVIFTQTTAANDDDQRFFINGETFDAERTDVRVKLGNTEEWTIRNESDDLHVFHIHQIGFQVIELNGKPVPFTGYIDNVLVPERGEVKLRMPFTNPLIVGRFMFHCHVLKHEDKGMMANIEVYDATPPTLIIRLDRLYRHVLWWWYGVPWSQCGLSDA